MRNIESTLLKSIELVLVYTIALRCTYTTKTFKICLLYSISKKLYFVLSVNCNFVECSSCGNLLVALHNSSWQILTWIYLVELYIRITLEPAKETVLEVLLMSKFREFFFEHSRAIQRLCQYFGSIT